MTWQTLYDEDGGYDCMTAAVAIVEPHVTTDRVISREWVVARLDGADYGQKRCASLTPEQRAALTKNAKLIAAAPALLRQLKVASVAIHHLQEVLRDIAGCEADVALAEDVIRQTREVFTRVDD